MKHITVGLVGLLLLSVGSSLRAEESEGEKAFQSYAKHAVGGVWKTTAPVTEVVDGEMTVTDQMVDMVDEYRSFADGQFVRYFATRDGKTGDFIGVLGVDPSTEKCTWWSFSHLGVRTTTITQEKEGVWIMHRTGVGPEGIAFSLKTRLSAPGKNEIYAERIEAIAGGEKKAIVTPPRTWTRHEGTIVGAPLVETEEAAKEEAETDAEKAFRSYATDMVGGVWKHTGVNGQEHIRRYRWLANRKFLYASIGANEQQPDAIAIYGINPDTEKLTAWHFGKSGLITITVTPQGDNVWMSEGGLTDEAGTKTTWKARETRIGPNEVHVELLETTEDGQKVEGPEWSQTWKRHKE